MYISFFNGLPTQNGEEYCSGDAGPIVGPVNVSWTFNTIKVHKVEPSPTGEYDHDLWEEWEWLPRSKDKDLIKLGRMYYADFEVWSENDPLLKEESNKKRIMSYDKFVKRFIKKKK